MSSVAFQGESRVVSAGTDGSARVWAWSHGVPETLPPIEIPNRGGASFGLDGRVTLVLADGATQVWRPGSTPRPDLPRLPSAAAPVAAAAVTPDGRAVVTASDAGRLVVRDAAGTSLGSWAVGGFANDLATDRTGTRVAVALNEGPVVAVRVGDPKVRTLGRDPSSSIAVAVSPDGSAVAFGGREGTVRLWSEGSPVRTLGAMEGPVFGVAFSPDGAHVAASGADKTVRVFAVEGGEEPVVLRGHRDVVPSVAFTADGDRLVSGGLDGIRVWEWRRRVTLFSRSAPQGAIQVSPLGAAPRIAHYGFDHVVSVDACDVCGPVEDVEALVARRTTRALSPEERSDFRVDGS